jgi:poly(A) polymerase
MLTDRSWLDHPATRTLIAALDSGGVDFRFVGGAVRNALLGRPVADIDIATPVTPEFVIRAVEAAGLKAIPTGMAHGTVTALVGRRPFEITTLRRDIETDGRHAVVAFTDDWRADAARRDFTMNALYADRDGAITDFFGGEGDARAGRVRFIGDPQQRIAEDALRILRFFRFNAWYGGPPFDAAGLAACAKLAAMLGGLSGERLRAELFKTLQAPDPVPVWQAMAEAGITAQLVPEAKRLQTLSGLVLLEQTLAVPADPLRRLAALIGKPSFEIVGGLRSRLRLTNLEEAYLLWIGAAAERVALVVRRDFGQALYHARPDWVRDAAMLAHVESGAPDPAILAELGEFIHNWREPRLPVSGKDIQALGIEPGPELGRILTELEDWWVASDFHPDRDACLARLGETII